MAFAILVIIPCPYGSYNGIKTNWRHPYYGTSGVPHHDVNHDMRLMALRSNDDPDARQRARRVRPDRVKH